MNNLIVDPNYERLQCPMCRHQWYSHVDTPPKKCPSCGCPVIKGTYGGTLGHA